MVRKNRDKQRWFFVWDFEKFFLTLIGVVLIIYGSLILFDNKISAKGSLLRGMGWEAEGFPAIGMAIFIIYIGIVIIYYTLRK